MAIVTRPTTKNQYLYRAMRDGKTVRKVYLGKVGDPSVELVIRAQRLKDAILANERARRQSDCKSAKTLEPFLKILADIAANWRLLEKWFKSYPGWDRGELLNAPFGWAGDPYESRLAVLRIIRMKKLSPAELRRLCAEVENNDPIAIAILTEKIVNQQELFAATVDLVAISRAFVVDAITAKSPTTSAAVEAKINAVEKDLGYEKARDGLERLLINITTVTYLDAMKCHALSAQATDTQQAAQFWSTMSIRSNKNVAVAAKALADYRTRLRRRQK